MKMRSILPVLLVLAAWLGIAVYSFIYDSDACRVAGS